MQYGLFKVVIGRAPASSAGNQTYSLLAMVVGYTWAFKTVGGSGNGSERPKISEPYVVRSYSFAGGEADKYSQEALFCGMWDRRSNAICHCPPVSHALMAELKETAFGTRVRPLVQRLCVAAPYVFLKVVGMGAPSRGHSQALGGTQR